MENEKNNLVLRYSRQLILSDWSLSKQKKIQNLKVLIDLDCDSLLWSGAALGIQDFYFSKNYLPSHNLLKGLNDFNSQVQTGFIEDEDSFNLLFTSDLNVYKNKIEIETRFLVIKDLSENCFNLEITHFDKDKKIPLVTFRNFSIKSSQIPINEIIGPLLINLALEFV